MVEVTKEAEGESRVTEATRGHTIGSDNARDGGVSHQEAENVKEWEGFSGRECSDNVLKEGERAIRGGGG